MLFDSFKLSRVVFGSVSEEVFVSRASEETVPEILYVLGLSNEVGGWKMGSGAAIMDTKAMVGGGGTIDGGVEIPYMVSTLHDSPVAAATKGYCAMLLLEAVATDAAIKPITPRSFDIVQYGKWGGGKGTRVE